MFSLALREVELVVVLIYKGNGISSHVDMNMDMNMDMDGKDARSCRGLRGWSGTNRSLMIPNHKDGRG